MDVIGPVISVTTKTKIPLNGHLWHVIEAAAFILTSLGGIWLSEVLHRRRSAGAGALGTADGRSVSSYTGTGAAVAKAPFSLLGHRSRVSARPRSGLLPLVGFGYFGAAAVHFVVMPEHFEEATLYGVFFVVAATLQVVFGLLVLARPTRPLIVVGLVGNLVVIALWAVTRTVGIPVGPDNGHPESVSGLDVIATGFEVLIVSGSLALLWRRHIRPALRPSSWAVPIWLFAAASVVAIAVTTVVAPPS